MKRRLPIGLFAKFLLVLVPVFAVLSAIGIVTLSRYDVRAKTAELGARVGNSAARVADAIGRHDPEGERGLAQDLLNPLANDLAIQCVELRRASDRAGRRRSA